LKKITALLVCLFIITATFCSCGYEYADIEYDATYSRELAGTTLNVYNWGEYISDGGDDSIDVNLEFEKLTGIKVNYVTYESNETMYSQLKSGGVSYDIIIPSDYMIERLKNENMLKKLDYQKLTNFKYIDNKYKNLFYDKNNEYTVTYNVGMVGVIYNPTIIGEPEHTWKSLWSKKYKDMSLNFSNPRDCFMTAQMILGYSLNSTKKSEWKEACELLKKGKGVLQSYVMDEVYGKMETGEAGIGPYYAGDYLTMAETNPDLKFYYPEEGTNIFVDAICVPSSVKNYEAAMMYINFLSEPQIALANAEYIGYASPNTSVVNNEDYLYYKNPILYPKEKDMPKTEYYHDLAPELRSYYENLWLDVKLY